MNLHGINLQNLALLSGFSAVIAPYFAAFLTRTHFKPVINSVIVWIVCAVMGASSYFASGGSPDNLHTSAALLAAISAVFTGAKLFYLKVGYKDPFLAWLQSIGDAAKKAQAAADTPPVPPVPAAGAALTAHIAPAAASPVLPVPPAPAPPPLPVYALGMVIPTPEGGIAGIAPTPAPQEPSLSIDRAETLAGIEALKNSILNAPAPIDPLAPNSGGSVAAPNSEGTPMSPVGDAPPVIAAVPALPADIDPEPIPAIITDAPPPAEAAVVAVIAAVPVKETADVV